MERRKIYSAAAETTISGLQQPYIHKKLTSLYKELIITEKSDEISFILV